MEDVIRSFGSLADGTGVDTGPTELKKDGLAAKIRSEQGKMMMAQDDRGTGPLYPIASPCPLRLFSRIAPLFSSLTTATPLSLTDYPQLIKRVSLSALPTDNATKKQVFFVSSCLRVSFQLRCRFSVHSWFRKLYLRTTP